MKFHTSGMNSLAWIGLDVAVQSIHALKTELKSKLRSRNIRSHTFQFEESKKRTKPNETKINVAFGLWFIR